MVDLAGALKRLGGDRELFRQFVVIFDEDAPVLMQQIDEAIKAGDSASLLRHSHALKGLMSNFGAEPCIEEVSRLEQAARDGDVSTVSSNCELLKKLCDQLTSELKNIADTI